MKQHHENQRNRVVSMFSASRALCWKIPVFEKCVIAIPLFLSDSFRIHLFWDNRSTSLRARNPAPEPEVVSLQQTRSINLLMTLSHCATDTRQLNRASQRELNEYFERLQRPRQANYPAVLGHITRMMDSGGLVGHGSGKWVARPSNLHF